MPNLVTLFLTLNNVHPDADGEEDGEEEEDEDDSEDEDEGPGLAAIYNDHLEDDDDGDFEETGEEEEEDGEEEEEEDESKIFDFWNNQSVDVKRASGGVGGHTFFVALMDRKWLSLIV